MTPVKQKTVGSSTTSPVENTKRKEILIKVPKTENIIFIGAENYYDSFWLKMMFISAAYVMASKEQNFRPSTKKTIAYVDRGYTHAEKLTLDLLRDTKGFEIIKLASSNDIIDLLNRNRNEFKLQDVAFFSHGIINGIELNYWDDERISLNSKNCTKIDKNAFGVNGRLYSYACRTGISVNDDSFDNETEAKPEFSLAQKLANHCGIPVHAFLRRSFYGNVLRDRSQSAIISATLKKERQDKEGQLILIPPDHEALPHPDLASEGIDFENPLRRGPKKEGTDNYALWRKGGGLSLPTAAENPTGLPSEMRIFEPKK